jgi:hypothetical protein
MGFVARFKKRAGVSVNVDRLGNVDHALLS